MHTVKLHITRITIYLFSNLHVHTTSFILVQITLGRNIPLQDGGRKKNKITLIETPTFGSVIMLAGLVSYTRRVTVIYVYVRHLGALPGQQFPFFFCMVGLQYVLYSSMLQY